MTQTNSVGRVGILLIAITAVCLIIVIALQAATLHRQTSGATDNDEPTTDASVALPEEEYVRSLYPGMFLNVSEVEAMTSSWRNLSQHSTVNPIPIIPPECALDTCHIELAEYTTCCCKITTYFYNPKTAVDVGGVNRTLTQFNHVSQYFYTENCTQTVSTCQGCVCMATPMLYTAVYNVRPIFRQYAIGFFQIGSTCKDLNI